MTGRDNLYQEIKNKICQGIFQGTFSQGERIPAERVLAEELGVSRVTVRKALELLEEEGLVSREMGSGTTIRFQNKGHEGNLDMIALVAPAANPFFAQFVGDFQRMADDKGSFVLLMQKPERETMANCLYRLYQKNLNNVVIWLEDNQIQQEQLKILRALGMNMVFFDTNKGLPYGDCVTLDNEKAMEVLIASLQRQEYGKISYLGWNNLDVYSIQERKNAFLKYHSQGEILEPLNWKDKKNFPIELVQKLQKKEAAKGDAVICGDRECAEILAASPYGKQIKIACIDEIESARKRKITTYRQDFVEISQAIYQCLHRQNTKAENWKAKSIVVPGILKER